MSDHEFHTICVFCGGDVHEVVHDVCPGDLPGRTRLAEARATIVRVEKLTCASDDGSEYEHDHGIGDGHDQCPACWAEDIRRALDGAS